MKDLDKQFERYINEAINNADRCASVADKGSVYAQVALAIAIYKNNTYN